MVLEQLVQKELDKGEILTFGRGLLYEYFRSKCNAQVGTRTCRNFGQKTTIIADRLLRSHMYLISKSPMTRL